MTSRIGRSALRLIKKKNEPKALYVCGLPDCRALVELPKRSLTAQFRHRDKNDLRCDGLLVLLEITPEGKQQHMEDLFQKRMRKAYRQQTGHD